VARREIERLTCEELEAQLEQTRYELAQLREALDSRVVIEQAKGVLAERLAIPVGEAFQILRYAARSHRTKLHEIARRVVEEGQTPAPVVVAIARASRVRAASMREVSHAHQERLARLQAKLREQQARFAREPEAG
jgi:hypothetical protein